MLGTLTCIYTNADHSGKWAGKATSLKPSLSTDMWGNRKKGRSVCDSEFPLPGKVDETGMSIERRQWCQPTPWHNVEHVTDHQLLRTFVTQLIHCWFSNLAIVSTYLICILAFSCYNFQTEGFSKICIIKIKKSLGHRFLTLSVAMVTDRQTHQTSTVTMCTEG